MNYPVITGFLVVGLLAQSAGAHSLSTRTGSVDVPGFYPVQYEARGDLVPPNKPLDRPVEPGDSLRPGQATPYLPTAPNSNRSTFNPPPGAYPPGSARPGSLPPRVPGPAGPLPPAPPIVGLPPVGGPSTTPGFR